LSDPVAVSFTRRAEKQVEDASAWWRENRTKAPDAFADDLEQALDLIARQPYTGTIVESLRTSARRVYLARTGYYLYYRVRGVAPRAVQVLAVWHSSRGRLPRL